MDVKLKGYDAFGLLKDIEVFFPEQSLEVEFFCLGFFFTFFIRVIIRIFLFLLYLDPWPAVPSINWNRHVLGARNE